MSVALRLPPATMTVDEFLDWDPGDNGASRWQLIDGEPVAMAPPIETHGRIMAELAFRMTLHLRAARPECSVVIQPGVVPRVRADTNMRVPDLGVTCAPPDARRREIADPVLLIEVLSPSNQRQTRANIWSYTTLPSVQELLLLRCDRIAGELLRRDAAGAWPPEPQHLEEEDALELHGIAFAMPLHEAYATTILARPPASP